MKNKLTKEDSRLNKLDRSAEKIGMGGNLIPNITEEKYKERMQKRTTIGLSIKGKYPSLDLPQKRVPMQLSLTLQ